MKHPEEEENNTEAKDMDVEWLSRFLEDAPYRACWVSADADVRRRSSQRSTDDPDTSHPTPAMTSVDLPHRGVEKEGTEADRESKKKGSNAADWRKSSFSLPQERYESLLALIMDQYEFL